MIWLGSEGSMEERIVPQHDILLEKLAIKGVRGNGIKRKLMLPFTLFKTIREAQRIIRKHRVACVIGFGGFVTFPGGVAAKLCGVPVVIHEQNAVAGLSNRMLRKSPAVCCMPSRRLSERKTDWSAIPSAPILPIYLCPPNALRGVKAV